MTNAVLETSLRDLIIDFMEPKNFSIVEYDIANYGGQPVVELPESGENVKGPEGVDPERYKDIFVSPTRFRDVWNHPDKFQRKMWRGAI